MMKKCLISSLFVFLFACACAYAQEAEEKPMVLSLEDALKIALSENVSVKVADKEVERTQYAKKGAYAALYPQIDGSASYQRTIKRQVMYMDINQKGGSIPGMSSGSSTESGSSSSQSSSSQVNPADGIEVGRLNTFSTGVMASMPLVNAQLWKSLQISGQDVELAVEKARSSRLEMVTQVKQAFYSVLLAKETLAVFTEVYDNAVENLHQTEMRYNAQKASELDYIRAKTNVANAIPNVYDAESSVFLALWQLKAVMGLDLDIDIDVDGNLEDYSEHMLRDVVENGQLGLEGNSSMRQLAIQAEQLANNIKMQQYASIPSLATTFSYSINAMANDFNFTQYRWSPYSYVGFSLSIPIFSGGKRHFNTRQAKVQYEELQLQKQDTERQLKIAIRQYLNQMEADMKSYAAAEVAVESARKAYTIAAKSYNVGRGTLTDLNDAQLSLTQAELSVSQTIFDFITTKASLEQVLGHSFIQE